MANPILMLLEGNGSLAGRDRAGSFTATGSGALRYAPAPGARINYAVNSSFENASLLSVLPRSGATVTRSSEQAYSGSNSLKIVSVGGSTDSGANGIGQIVSGAFGVGQTYTFSVYIYSDVETSIRLVIEEKTATPSYLTGTSSPVFNHTGGGWQRFSVTRTLTNAAVNCLHGVVAVNDTTSRTIYVDAAMIEAGSSATTYLDGASAGAVWLDPVTGALGTPHGSPSVSRAAFWIEEATTNTVRDPSFEAATITTNWTAAGSATISKVTTHAYVGSNGGKVSCTASTSDGIDQLATSGAAASNGQPWTVSGRIRAFAAADVGKTVKPAIIERTSADAVVATNLGSAITLTDAWQAFSYTVTLAGGGTVAKVTCGFRAGAATAVDFVLDAVQLEQKAYATSYCDGTLGTGYSWSGTAHASTSSRTAATDSAATTNRINISAGSAVFRYQRSVDTSGEEIYGEVGTKGASTDHIRWGVDSSDRAFVEWSSNNAAYQRVTRTGSLSIGTKYVWYVDWSGTTANIALGTESLTSGTRAAISGSWGAGNIVLEAVTGGDYIGPVVIYDRPLTAAERAKVSAAIDSNGAASLWTVLGSNAYRNFQLRPISQ